MVIKNVGLETVCGITSVLPVNDKPEFAFAGKSNVGKSSLINALMQRKSLARTSSEPGKTQTINFYNINDELYFVDLPGYGYAKVSRAESEKWGKMMESYLENRENLLKVVQLVDIRHKPSAQDVQMYDYLKYYGLDGIVVATKADKVSRNEMTKCIKEIRNSLGMEKDDVVVPCSALKKTGHEELLNIIDELIENA